MCLAIPARVIQLDSRNDSAIVEVGGVQKSVSTTLVQSIDIGDYVLIHVGYVLNKIDPHEAEKTLELFTVSDLE